MLDGFFITINTWLSASLGLALLASFLWGLVSIIFSPCHLASIPLVISYVAGQKTLIKGKEAAAYSLLFSLGLFISIALVGIVCSMLGRILGDVSVLWNIPIGALFIFLGLNFLGVAACNFSLGRMGIIKLQGYFGAFILGLSYGILSGACTFGFIAPILAVMSIQEQFLNGVILILLFALGHCLPIVLSGSSVALAQKILLAKGIQQATVWGRKIAGGLVILIGLYLIYSGISG